MTDIEIPVVLAFRWTEQAFAAYKLVPAGMSASTSGASLTVSGADPNALVEFLDQLVEERWITDDDAVRAVAEMNRQLELTEEES